MKEIWRNKKAFVRYEKNQMVISAPFDSNFVNELKAESRSRRWNPETKSWTLDILERDKALPIIRQYFDVIEKNQPSEAIQIVKLPQNPVSDKHPLEVQTGDKVEIWTDGACEINPGPGGYAAVFKHKGRVRELSGGFALTTNNRMEIMAAIVALESLKSNCSVTLFSDSTYLVKAMTLGWVKRWEANGWKRKHIDKVMNYDLWQRLLEACTKHEVEFIWIKGHSSIFENERCDELAETTARLPGLPRDRGYLKYSSKDGETNKEIKTAGEEIEVTVCPICGGTGYRMVPSGPKSHAEVKILCSQCIGKGRIL